MPPPLTTRPSARDRQEHLEIREKLALLELIQEVTQTGTWAWDLRSGKVSWSRELERIYGYTGGTFPENYEGFADRVYPEDLARLEIERSAAIAAHRPYRTDFRIRLPSGETRWLYSACAAEYASDGLPVRIIGINIDITERKRSEEALLASEARYRAVVEDQTETIARIRADGTLTFVNEIYCRFFGVTSAVLGTRWQPLAHPDDLPMIEAKLTTLSPANPVVVIENRVFAATGETRWMQFVNRAFFESNGTLREIQSVGRDITEHRAILARQAALLEENTRLGHELIRLQEKERTELAQELHDEQSQQLAAIRIHAAVILRRHGGNNDPSRENAEAIDVAAREIYQVSHRIMEGLHPQILDSAGLVEALAAAVSAWSSRHPAIRVRFRVGQGIGTADANTRIHLFRIVQECLTNVARHSAANAVRLFLGRGRSAPGSLRVVVRDNGRGLPEDASRTGYGMIVMRERVQSLGGRLTIDSCVGDGLRIAIDIPSV